MRPTPCAYCSNPATRTVTLRPLWRERGKVTRIEIKLEVCDAHPPTPLELEGRPW